MNFSCIFLLVLALAGVITQAYVSPVYSGMYNGLCAGTYGTTYGAGHGLGYSAGYETGYGCRSGCAPACGTAAVCDTCQCVKTVVRPNVVERIPYNCARRVQSSTCRSTSGLYPNGVYGNTDAGYLNGGYFY